MCIDKRQQEKDLVSMNCLRYGEEINDTVRQRVRRLFDVFSYRQSLRLCSVRPKGTICMWSQVLSLRCAMTPSDVCVKTEHSFAVQTCSVRNSYVYIYCSVKHGFIQVHNHSQDETMCLLC